MVEMKWPYHDNEPVLTRASMHQAFIGESQPRLPDTRPQHGDAVYLLMENLSIPARCQLADSWPPVPTSNDLDIVLSRV